MTPWLTTEAVTEHLGISRPALMELVRAPSERPAWALYAGDHGTRSARYRWRSDRVDDWFEEVCRWRASQRSTATGASDGATEDGEPELTSARSEPAGSRKRSPKKSKTPSPASDDSSLVRLAARLRSP